MRWRRHPGLAIPTAGGAILFLVVLAVAQEPRPANPEEDPDAPPKDASVLSQGLFLPADVELRKKIEAVPEYVKAEQWERVFKSLQPLLDTPEDALVPLTTKGPDGKPVTRYVSLWAEAGRLLGTLPARGLESYEVAQGGVARNMLREARANHSLELLAETGRRYLHTESGTRSAELLATHHLDRGQAVPAAFAFDRLLRSALADRLPEGTLFKAALAFRLAGDDDGFKRAWKRLEEKSPDGIRLGDRRATLDALRKDLDAFRSSGPSDGAVPSGSPELEPVWRQPLVRDETAAAWLREAANRTEARGLPLIPPAIPVIAGGRVFTRSHAGVLAADLRTGRTAWEWRSDRSLESLAADDDGERTSHYVSQWVAGYYGMAPQLLFENSVLGTLTADTRRIYAIEDLPLPPFPPNYAGYVGKAGQGLRFNFAELLDDTIYHSRLVALDQAGGKVVWEVGGRGRRGGALADAHFLGPPLPLDGLLYQLVEKNQEMRLVCLEPLRGELQWSQTLAYTRNRLILDGGRRLHALTPALVDGFLLCPTGAGAVFAVDRLSHRILWAHVYREEQPPPPLPDYGRGRWRPRIVITAPPNLSADWKVTPPIVHGNTLVFTAPEDDSIHCVRLRDGGSEWRMRRALGDQYIAGIAGGHLVTVGDERVRGLSLSEGKLVWSVAVGVPTGRGVLAGKRLFLPVEAKTDGKGPAVRVVDVEKGAVADTLLMPGKEKVGNLLFSEGQVLSQTATELIAYPVK